MHIVDRGQGVPLLLIPGIQGRWEYMRPAIDALERSFRVITFPLSGERGTDGRFDLEKGLDNFVEQIDAVLDKLGIERAVIGGVSFGGLIGLHAGAAVSPVASPSTLRARPATAWSAVPRRNSVPRRPGTEADIFRARGTPEFRLGSDQDFRESAVLVVADGRSRESHHDRGSRG